MIIRDLEAKPLNVNNRRFAFEFIWHINFKMAQILNENKHVNEKQD